MLTRRAFLGVSTTAAATAAAALTSCGSQPKADPVPSQLTSRERVDRVLAGRAVDRPPYTFWYHFGLEKFPGTRHAQATLEFHQKFNTDIVKVMSDFPYPKSTGGRWYELSVVEDPFPEQMRALDIINGNLQGKVHILETIFNPYNVAEKLSSPQEVQRLKQENPQALLDALEVIAKSEANHARRAVAAGASGIFLAIANAQMDVMTPEDYAKFSEPFDKMVLAAVEGRPLNTLHLHGHRIFFDRFYTWNAPVIHYSVHETAVPFVQLRSAYQGVLMGGIDETRFRTLSETEIQHQMQVAQWQAGNKLILAPGCSVPNETQDDELMRFVKVVSPKATS
jgi:uroporphyrinogen decarboxylase